MRRTTCFGILVFLVILGNDNLAAQELKLTASDAAETDHFGHAVVLSADGSYALVGSPGRNSVFVYKRNGSKWIEQTELVVPVLGDISSFGEAVSINGDGTYALIGAKSENNSRGGAYIFKRTNDTWVEQTRLLSRTRYWREYFGKAVSISHDGQYALVGTGHNYVFVFERTTTLEGEEWGLLPDSLVASLPGTSYEHYEDTIKISANGDYIAFSSSFDGYGRVFVFARNGLGWTEQVTLTPSSVEQFDEFGEAVAMNGDANYLLVSAPRADIPLENAGTVYVYVRSGSTWSEVDKLTSFEDTKSFGKSIALNLNENIAIIGSQNRSLTHRSRAYTFVRHGGTWSLRSEIVPADSEIFEVYASSVSLSADGRFALVGDSGDDAYLPDAGAAYLYDQTHIPVSLHRLYLHGPMPGDVPMQTDLNSAGLLPTTQPYSGTPWHYGGTESVPPNFFAAHPDIVDWVLVDLQSGDPSTPPMTRVSRRVGFVKAEGSIVDLDGESPLLLEDVSVTIVNPYVVVRHRNHLDVMSEGTLRISPHPAFPYYFTSGTYGTNARYHNGFQSVLWGGDGNADGAVTALDFLTIWLPENGTTGYKQADFSLNGSITSFDFLQLWLVANGQVSQVPQAHPPGY